MIMKKKLEEFRAWTLNGRNNGDQTDEKKCRSRVYRCACVGCAGRGRVRRGDREREIEKKVSFLFAKKKNGQTRTMI